MEYTINHACTDPFDELWEAQHSTNGDDWEVEDDVDDMIEDCYDDEDE